MTADEILESLESDLRKYREIELILLKGHLILEQALNQHLAFHIADRDRLDGLNLMFSKKLDLLMALEGGEPFSHVEGIKHLKEINRIRNKLAHQLKFDEYHADLKKWACNVLGYKPKTIDRKSTYRNMVIKAFFFLAGYLIGHSQGKAAVIELKSNKSRKTDA